MLRENEERNPGAAFEVAELLTEDGLPFKFMWNCMVFGCWMQGLSHSEEVAVKEAGEHYAETHL